MIRRFAVLGGGSAYAPGLIQALIHHRDALELTEIRLYDIDSERLELVSRLCDRMARAEGAPFSVQASSSLADALSDADCVLNSTRPGGLECRRLDETLPLELDIPGQETVGPGGFFFALRSVPAALEIAETMTRVCPSAVLLNYTNPTNIVTQALRDTSAIEVIGLCDQSDEDLEGLASALGQHSGSIRARTVGLNHATWYEQIEIDNQRIEEFPTELTPPEGYDDEHKLRFTLSLELALGRPGLWPNSYLPYYTHPSRFVAAARRAGPRSDAIIEKLPEYYAHFEEEARRERPHLKKHRGTSGFGDLAVRTLVALGSETEVPMILNHDNEGASSELAAETVIETNFLVSSAGLRASVAPPLPADQRPLIERLESYQRAAAGAAQRGGEEALIAALAKNPLVDGRSKAEHLMRRAREEYAGRLPQFP